MLTYFATSAMPCEILYLRKIPTGLNCFEIELKTEAGISINILTDRARLIPRVFQITDSKDW